MLISNLLLASFQTSMSLHKEIHKKWIDLSYKLGSQLPASLLSFSVQRAGRLDMLLRSIENEGTNKPTSDQENLPDFSFDNLCFFSELWIGHTYEIFRILMSDQSRKIYLDDKKLIFHDLELIRIPLEKYEIAGDRKLKEPLDLVKYPLNGNESDYTSYSEDDPQKTHTMPVGVSPKGSVMWHTIDIRNNTSKWIERRDISDRIISLLDDFDKKV